MRIVSQLRNRFSFIRLSVKSLSNMIRKPLSSKHVFPKVQTLQHRLINSAFIAMKLVIAGRSFCEKEFQHPFYLSARSSTQSLCTSASVKVALNASKNISTTHAFANK